MSAPIISSSSSTPSSSPILCLLPPPGLSRRILESNGVARVLAAASADYNHVYLQRDAVKALFFITRASGMLIGHTICLGGI
jgi:hypothetical protein